MSESKPEKTTAEGKKLDVAAFDKGWIAADQAMMNLLKSVEQVSEDKTIRAAARARIFGDEKVIEQLQSRGVSSVKILASYCLALPHIPREDLRLALEALRLRKVRNSKPQSLQAAPSARAQPKPVQQPLAAKVPTVQRMAVSTTYAGVPMPAWADGTDLLPGETEAEYAFRKTIEGDPAVRAKFIGEGQHS